MKQILLIDDDNSLRRVMEFQLQEAGYQVLTARDGQQGLVAFRQHRPPLVITDVQMPGISGYDVLQEVLSLEPQTLVIIVTAFSTVEQAVDAMKVGAYDYLAKPFSRDQLCLTVAKAFEFRNLKQENSALRDVLAARDDSLRIIGESSAMTQLLQRVEKVAVSQASILISGESGTGKEVIAQTIHQRSERHAGPFIAVNCAAIPKDLIESELFGHIKGSFTGAVKDRKGKFSLADKGTLFLDEIGELPVDLQPKLLRALQEQQIEPVGGTTEQVDVRVVAATNRNLEEAMAAGTFRDDLYYRLAVVPLELPPLRQRKEDIPLFVQYFLNKQQAGAQVRMTDQVLQSLQKYDWPGNVRELENVVEQMLILRNSDVIDLADLPERIGRPAGRGKGVLNLPEEGYSLEELEKEAVVEALRRCQGNKSKAANFLRIPRHTLLYRLEKYHIEA
ncbi:sigma-54-dependent transcriptional regulator [Pelobacter seleniigenes]|uniref:sigma-54-dependent transcriptional regulator n=1 Tax=Pelobacter seleniigenes TaxID=407188 RepID=UPI0004A745E4|nr:sigma-54 dependent transcriptional regulator [Pelobacter seleniigenes]